jgi:hypothetical protein
MSGSLLTQPLRLGGRGAGLVIHETVSLSQRALHLLGLGGGPGEPIATEAVHVSENPQLVKEIAEPGAEDGAGAQVRIAEPWEGYRLMTAADIIDRLASASREELATVELYELAGRQRTSVVAAAQRALKQAPPPGSPPRGLWEKNGVRRRLYPTASASIHQYP